jgi:hypothetical protein
MKVWELINELSKLPAGKDVFVWMGFDYKNRLRGMEGDDISISLNGNFVQLTTFCDTAEDVIELTDDEKA